jgi:hypothetical protein
LQEVQKVAYKKVLNGDNVRRFHNSGTEKPGFGQEKSERIRQFMNKID